MYYSVGAVPLDACRNHEISPFLGDREHNICTMASSKFLITQALCFEGTENF
jgi:hypothetical protein